MIEQQQKLVLSPYMEIYELVIPKDNLLRQIKELVDCNYSEPPLFKDEIRVTCDRIFDCFVSIVSLFMCRAYVGHDF